MRLVNRDPITNDSGRASLLTASYIWCEQVYNQDGGFINHSEESYMGDVAKRLHLAVELYEEMERMLVLPLENIGVSIT